jgi:hypothetical protein
VVDFIAIYRSEHRILVCRGSTTESRRSPAPPKRHCRRPWRVRHSTAEETSHPGGSKSLRRHEDAKQLARSRGGHRARDPSRRTDPEKQVVYPSRNDRPGRHALIQCSTSERPSPRRPEDLEQKRRCKARCLERQPARCVTDHPKGTVAIRLSSPTRRKRIHVADVKVPGPDDADVAALTSNATTSAALAPKNGVRALHFATAPKDGSPPQ